MTKRSASENTELLKRAADGDKSARDELVLNNMGLVYSVVKRFGGRGYERDDLIQIGSIGLIRAAERFDLSFGVQFSTYAIPMIIGEIKRFIRDDGIIKVSRSLKETAAAAARARKDIEASAGREATVGEIAERIGVTPEELASAIDSQQPPQSIYAAADNGMSEFKTLADKIESKGNEIEHMLGRVLVEELIKSLSSRDKMIVDMRYFKNKTQAETAKMLGISQVQVSRLEKKILLNLRSGVKEE